MEEEQQFCLKWNHFQWNITSQFEALKDEGEFLDVTLASQGRLIKAHKVILSACSPFFKKIFQDNPCKHPVVILQDVNFGYLQSLITFMYTGQVYIPETQLPSFLKTAEILQVKGLSDPTTTQKDASNILPHALTTTAQNQTTSQLRKRPHATVPQQNLEEGDKESETEISSFGNQSSKRVIRSFSQHSEQESVELKKETEYFSDGEVKVSDNKSDTPSQDPKNVENFYEPSPSTSFTCNLVENEYPLGDCRKPHSLDPRPCPVCNRIYSNLSNLRQHMRLIHNPTFVTCKLCLKTFKTDLYLRRHLISFHEINLYPFVNNLVSIEPALKGDMVDKTNIHMEERKENQENIYERYQEQKRRLSQFTESFFALPPQDTQDPKNVQIDDRKANIPWNEPQNMFSSSENEFVQVKTEPNHFQDIFNTGKIFQVPE